MSPKMVSRFPTCWPWLWERLFTDLLDCSSPFFSPGNMSRSAGLFWQRLLFGRQFLAGIHVLQSCVVPRPFRFRRSSLPVVLGSHACRPHSPPVDIARITQLITMHFFFFAVDLSRQLQLLHMFAAFGQANITFQPPNASPQNRPVNHQDSSFLGTLSHPPPPVSPSVGVRGPPNAYVDTRNFDDSSIGPIRSNEPSSFFVDRSGNPVRTPLRQSMPITASARSSTSAMQLPPVQPNDLPWATGKTATSQLPRVYESAPPSAAVVPNTSTTWGYVRDSSDSFLVLTYLSHKTNWFFFLGHGGGFFCFCHT